MITIRYSLGYTVSLGEKTYTFVKPEISCEMSGDKDPLVLLNECRKRVQDAMKFEMDVIKSVFPLAKKLEVIETSNQENK